MNQFQERLQQYKYMQQSKEVSAAGYRSKIPDIKKSLDMVLYLSSKKDTKESIETNFELNDTLYTRAEIPPTSLVFLWLGADIMLEYPVDEAIGLLTEKLNTAKKNLQICEEDMQFLRENITTMEVNTARLYNWDVQKRKATQPNNKSKPIKA